jgi:hypothetical protein
MQVSSTDIDLPTNGLRTKYVVESMGWETGIESGPTGKLWVAAMSPALIF